MTQLAFDFETEPPAECRHRRTTTSPAHQLCADGGCCNHDEVCDDCGRRVGTESWNLTIGRKEHDKTHGRAA